VTDQLRILVADATSWWEAAAPLASFWYARGDTTLDPYGAESEEWNRYAVEVQRRLTDDVEPADFTAVLEAAGDAALDEHLMAHAACEAICERFGPGFSESWAASHGAEVAPATTDPFPLGWRDRDALPRKQSTYPPQLVSDLDAFSYIRPARPIATIGSTDVRVVFDFSAQDLLAPLDTGGIPALVACHLNPGPDSLTWPPDPPATQFGVRPVDSQAQATAAVEALDRAAAENAVLMLGTECAADEGVVERLRLHQLQAAGPLPVAVGGSHHTDSPVPPMNVAELVAGGRRVVAHQKIVGIAGPGLPWWDEGIASGTQLRIFVAGRTRLAVVICRDLLEPAIQQLLGWHGANLVCVPALTPTLRPFDGPARTLSDHTQGTVIVANNPAWVPQGAEQSPVDVNPPTVIELPLEDDRSPRIRRSDGSLVGLTVLSPDGSGRWEAL
jgi:hypothetical protein